MTAHVLPFVRDLEFTAPLEKCTIERCFIETQNDADDGSDSESGDEVLLSLSHHEHLMERLSREANSVLTHMSQNTLRQLRYQFRSCLSDVSARSDGTDSSPYRWHLACCVPESILGSSGYIPLN
jgi:hypothetical protein